MLIKTYLYLWRKFEIFFGKYKESKDYTPRPTKKKICFYSPHNQIFCFCQQSWWEILLCDTIHRTTNLQARYANPFKCFRIKTISIDYLFEVKEFWYACLHKEIEKKCCEKPVWWLTFFVWLEDLFNARKYFRRVDLVKFSKKMWGLLVNRMLSSNTS